MLGRTAGHRWDVVLDCPDPHELAGFYARILGWDVTDVQADDVVVRPPGDGVASLLFQRSREYVAPAWPPEPGRQQMMAHLDFAVPDLEPAVAAAVAAGARVAGYQPQDGVRVLLDPAGHPFCLYVDTTGGGPAEADRA